MYTHCPECSTYFRITAEQLRAAQGKVRCSNCETVFNALETLEETLPAGQVTANEDRTAPTDKGKPAKKAKKPKKPKQPGRLTGLIKALLGILISLALMAAFLGQFAYYKRNNLVQKYPLLKPYMEQACQYAQMAHIPCDFDLRHDYSQLSLEHKDIRVHPRMKKSLLINANLLNQANFVQPYPVVQLTFTDSQGKVVAQRGFKPQEYLSNPAQAETGLGPRESALLVLEVLDPGPDAINFTFDFH